MPPLTFRTRWRNEADGWSAEGPSISAPSTVAALEEALRLGPVIVEHWHYRGGCAPSRRIFEEWEELETYLAEHAYAGDAVDLWSFSELCTPERRLAQGKCPDENGHVPRGGAY